MKITEIKRKRIKQSYDETLTSTLTRKEIEKILETNPQSMYTFKDYGDQQTSFVNEPETSLIRTSDKLDVYVYMPSISAKMKKEILGTVSQSKGNNKMNIRTRRINQSVEQTQCDNIGDAIQKGLKKAKYSKKLVRSDVMDIASDIYDYAIEKEAQFDSKNFKQKLIRMIKSGFNKIDKSIIDIEPVVPTVCDQVLKYLSRKDSRVNYTKKVNQNVNEDVFRKFKRLINQSK